MSQVEILYVSSSGLTALSGGGWTRIASEAREARKFGFSVRILCFIPLQHILLRPKFMAAAKASLEQNALSPVYFVPRLPLTRVAWISWLNDWFATFVILTFCLFYNIRIIHCHGILLARLGFMAKRIKGNIKIVVDVHGASVEEYMYEKRLAFPDRKAKIMEKQELQALKNADWIIFVSNAMRKYYEGKYNLLIQNSCIIPCATKGNFKIDSKKRQALRTQYGINEKIVFCYVGSAESYQLPEAMCRFFAEILSAFPNSFLLILSHHQEVFLNYLKASKIDSSHYKVLSVQHEDIFNLLQMGDIGLLLRDNSIVNHVASPTKFAEYLICGLPVIITDFVGDYSEMVKQHKLGWIIDLSQLSIDADLKKFIQDVEIRRVEYAEKCSSFARRYLSWESYGKVLANIYTLLLSEKSLF